MLFFGPPNIEKLKVQKNIKGLVKALKYKNKKDYETRYYAAKALGELRDPLAVKALCNSMKDQKDSLTLSGIIGALAEIGDLRAVEPLIDQLRGGGWLSSVCSVIKALEALGDNRAVQPLCEVLDKFGDTSVKIAAANALGEFGDNRAVQPLCKVLVYTKETSVKIAVVNALGKLKDQQAIESLRKILADKNFDVVLAAASALQTIKDPQLTEVFIHQFESSNRLAVLAFTKIGLAVPDNPIIKACLEIVANGDIQYAVTVGSAMVEPLSEIIRSSSIYCREDNGYYKIMNAAARALGDIGDDRVTKVLQEMFFSTRIRWNYCNGIIEALGKLRDESIIDPILNKLWSKPYGCYEYATGPGADELYYSISKAFVNINNDKAMQALRKLLSHSIKKLRQAAAESIVGLYQTVGLSDAQKKALLEFKPAITEPHVDEYYHGCGVDPHKDTGIGIKIEFPEI